MGIIRSPTHDCVESDGELVLHGVGPNHAEMKAVFTGCTSFHACALIGSSSWQPQLFITLPEPLESLLADSCSGQVHSWQFE